MSNMLDTLMESESYMKYANSLMLLKDNPQFSKFHKKRTLDISFPPRNGLQNHKKFTLAMYMKEKQPSKS